MPRLTDAWRALTSRPEGKAVGEDTPGAELVVSVTEAGRPVVPIWTYDYMAKVAVTANSTVAAAADYWARNLAEPALVVLDEPGGTPVDHPLTRLFAKPSPFFSQDELIQQLVYELCASDKGAFLLAPLSRAGEPLALWAKSADEVRIVPSTTAFIARFEMRVGAYEWKAVDPKEVAVCWFRLMHPTDKWGSWSPVAKVRREIRTDTNMGRWVDYSLQNMGKTSGLIGIDGLNDQGVANQVRDYINENLMGAHNAMKTSVVAGKVSKIDFGADFANLDFGPLQSRIEVATARGFGMAPELLHILATTTAGSGLGGERQTALDRQTYRNTLLPISKMLAAKIGSVFGPIYDLDPECIVFDYSTVQALQEDRDAAVKRMQVATWLTEDERRAQTGLPPLSEVSGQDGNRCLAVQQLDSLTSRLAPQKNAGGIETKALQGQPLRKAVDAVATSHETAMEKAARAIFAAQRASVLGSLKSAGTLERKVDVSADDVAGMMDDGEWGDFVPLVTGAMKDGALLHADALGMNLDMTNPKVAAAILKRVTKIQGADETTRGLIQQAVTDARASGATIADLAKAIGDVFDAAEGYRSTMIARTESIGAANDGGNTLAQEAVDAGIEVTKTWIAFQDERTRESHILLDGVMVDMDAAFDNGLMFPGDPDGDADEVINCRCSVGYEGAGPSPDEGA